ncbi:hypothetical protein [Nocardia sp. NPDC002869]|uniref:hypothetical protein n=1 Tax=Nocardia sp. NPDC002869 TaxID=3161032 RepID=UPI00398D527C
MSAPLGMPSFPPAVAVSGPPAQRHAVPARRIRWFVAATTTYNVVEAVIALSEGARVSSTALIGFGRDSVIEVSSAAAVAWQFAGHDPQAREKVALRIIALSFFALAAYVTVDSIRAPFGLGEAQHSPIGIGLAAASLVIMPILSAAQRRAGRELGSASAVEESRAWRAQPPGTSIRDAVPRAHVPAGTRRGDRMRRRWPRTVGTHRARRDPDSSRHARVGLCPVLSVVIADDSLGM